MTVVFIDGAHGTTGLEIVNRLELRSEFTLIALDDIDRKNPAKRRAALNDADVAILCLPDDAARDAVAMIGNDRTVVIDASTAHRTAPEWTFGFYEIFANGREALRTSKRISNPGCYPTGFLALIKPLVDAAIVPADLVLTVNAVSGYSGGGKTMIEEFERPEGAPSAWRSYGLTLAHKHVPEMQRHAGLTHPPIFAPSVANTYRGMIVEVPISVGLLPDPVTAAQIGDAWKLAYDRLPLMNIVTNYPETTLRIEHAAGTDRIDLFAFADETGHQLRLVAALDNLGKGAAGACVQSLNIVTGHSEIAGLHL